jgi:membrane-associated phospholipid phosphatase
MTTFLVALTVGLALVVPSAAFSQSTAAPPAEPSLRTFLPDLADDVRRLPSIQAGTSIAIGGIAAVALSELDDDMATWYPEGIFTGGSVLNGVVLGAGTLGAYGVAHLWDSPRAKHVIVDVLRAQVLALGITYALKYTAGRDRPDRSSNDSFPSGHTAQTFASATVLARHLGLQPTWPALVAAGFVAMSRVNQQRHFVSDVVFGASLGIAVGWNTRHRDGDWTVTPQLSASGVGLRVGRAWR